MTKSEELGNEKSEWWMYVDGATGKQGLGAEMKLVGRQRIKIKYTV